MKINTEAFINKPPIYISPSRKSIRITWILIHGCLHWERETSENAGFQQKIPLPYKKQEA